jgi:hypothetical protein
MKIGERKNMAVSEKFIDDMFAIFKEKKLTNQRMLNAMTIMYLDSQLKFEELRVGTKRIGISLREDAAPALQKLAHERHPDYPAYLQQLVKQEQTNPKTPMADLVRPLVDGLNAGFISPDEFDMILAACQLRCINTVFYQADDPLINKTKNEVEKEKAKGLPTKVVVEQAWECFQSGSMSIEAFALVAFFCGFSFKSSFVRGCGVDNKTYSIKDVIEENH